MRAAPRPAAVLALAAAALLAAAPALRAQETAVTLDAATLQSLDGKLRSFAAGLSAEERGAWAGLLRGAAGAPADNPAGTRLRSTFYAPGREGIVVQGGRTANEGIVVQGGRTANQGIVVQGGRTTRPGNTGAVAIGPKPEDPTRTGAVAIGPKPEDPGRTGAVAIGPKPEDPTRTGAVAIGPKPEDPTRTGAVAIGPKPEDPGRGLPAKLGAFAQGLTPAEKVALDWLLQRAASAPAVDGSAGGLPPVPTLAQALGLGAAGADFRATLRF